MKIEDIARIAYNLNRAYSLFMSDHSHPLWEEASEEDKKSTLAGVQYVLADKPDHPCPAEGLHAAWLAYKKAAGWTFGAVKSVERKKHPRMVAWHSLSDKQKIRDIIFGAVVQQLVPYLDPPVGNTEVIEHSTVDRAEGAENV